MSAISDFLCLLRFLDKLFPFLYLGHKVPTFSVASTSCTRPIWKVPERKLLSQFRYLSVRSTSENRTPFLSCTSVNNWCCSNKLVHDLILNRRCAWRIFRIYCRERCERVIWTIVCTSRLNIYFSSRTTGKTILVSVPHDAVPGGFIDVCIDDDPEGRCVFDYSGLMRCII